MRTRRRSADGCRSGRKQPGRLLMVGAATGAVALVLAGCGTTSSSGSGAGPASTGSPVRAGGPTVATATTPYGTVLVDSAGRTVYVFAADQPGRSNCSGSCATYWPPVAAPTGTATAAAGVSATLGSVARADGTRQLTVDGWPVYTYVGDHGPGTATGQGTNLSGGLWWVVSTSGTKITETAQGSASASPSSSATRMSNTPPMSSPPPMSSGSGAYGRSY